MPATDLDRLRAEYADRERRAAGHDLYAAYHPHNLFMYHQRDRAVTRLLCRYDLFPLTERRILELGCGGGRVLLDYLRYGVSPTRLHGVDLLPDRLSEAKTRIPSLPLVCADGQRLPYADASFDLVLQYTAFSSVLDENVQVNMAREMLRVVRRDGAIIWYDFWLNPSNPQTVGIRPDTIRRLFPNCAVEFQRVTLAPPITRRLIRVSWLACQLLESLRVLNSHYLALIRQ